MFDFDNIGKKICTLAVVSSLLGIAASLIFGLLLCIDQQIIGLVVILGGSLLSWISAFALYGFGELIKTNKEIAENTDAVYGILNDILFHLKTSDRNNTK